ncbi:MAG: hypothetical protein CTY10_08930 [Methylotenera sp.]|nr:MAG: hypothetical protein CTY10_08930 [Methylotenera sp.]
MTQLLVSVKSVEEALIALEAGVDIIDLKDPENGALGALDLALSTQIVHQIQQHNINMMNDSLPVNVSATVGEHHIDMESLINSILERALIKVDIIKVAISTFERISNWRNDLDIQKIRDVNPDIKLVAVFFADQKIDLIQLELLKKLGFYGAILDTSAKHQNLFEICTIPHLQMFTQYCQKNALKSGLAGSLKPQHIECLTTIGPSYIGFRGGVCEADARSNSLVMNKVVKVKKLLHEHNKFNHLARQC